MSQKATISVGAGRQETASPWMVNVSEDPEPSPSFLQFLLKGQTTLYLFFSPLPELAHARGMEY